MNSADQFETIVGAHYEALYRFAISLTQSEADACDLTQHTFYVWATKGHQLRDISKVKTWLFTTLHRAFLNSRQRQNRFVHYELEEVAEQLPVFSPNLADRLDSSHVLTALKKVDEVYQAAVALFYLEDYSYKEIAAILEVPIGTVKSRIARGIAQLRQFLLADDAGDSTAVRNEPTTTDDQAGPAAPPENIITDVFNKRPETAENSLSDYEEWDLSATFLPEHPGPA